MFNSQQFIINQYLDAVLVDRIYHKFKENLKLDIDDSIAYLAEFNIVWFVSFVILVSLLYLFAWKPVEAKLSKDYIKTKLLILLIPTKMIMKRSKLLDILKRENLVSIKK